MAKRFTGSSQCPSRLRTEPLRLPTVILGDNGRNKRQRGSCYVPRSSIQCKHKARPDTALTDCLVAGQLERGNSKTPKRRASRKRTKEETNKNGEKERLVISMIFRIDLLAWRLGRANRADTRDHYSLWRHQRVGKYRNGCRGRRNKHLTLTRPT